MIQILTGKRVDSEPYSNARDLVYPNGCVRNDRKFRID